ncbi:hypothetical protein D3C80_1634350 [compost metagenome]
MHSALVALPDSLIDLTIVLAPHRHFVNLEKLLIAIEWCRNFSRIELVVRVEGCLQLLQDGVKLAKEFWSVFRSNTFSVLAPQ